MAINPVDTIPERLQQPFFLHGCGLFSFEHIMDRDKIWTGKN